MEQGGHGMAIRQMCEGVELGSVNWTFHGRKGEDGKGRPKKRSR